MVFRYYGAFISGLQETVAAILKAGLPDLRIEKLLDGGILFETSREYSRLNFPCFNNLFAVISVMNSPGGALEAHIQRALRGDLGVFPVGRRVRSFRIITSRENKLVSVDEKLRRKAEAFIAARSGLRVDRTGPDTEFWFLYRREGCSFFMRRLSKHPAGEKTRQRGELAPQLAYMMCWLSSPKKTDTVADPFCGYGSIPRQRLEHFPLERFYAFDLDEQALAITRANLGSAALGSCVVRRADVRDIVSLLPEAGVDAIITDPPWGLYAKTAQAPELFYRDMIDIFGRVLKNGGICVILTARKEEMLLAAAASECLTITGAIPVLVSGKKAGIFILRKEVKAEDPASDPVKPRGLPR